MAVAYDTIADIWKVYDIGVGNQQLREYLVSNFCDVNGDPTVDWLKRDFDEYRLTYSRWLLQLMQNPQDSEYSFHKARCQYIIPRLAELGLNEGHRILIVGSGLGALVHAFRRAATYGLAGVNYPNVWGIEGSSAINAYYVTHKLDDDDATVWETFDSKKLILDAIETKTGFRDFHVIISEDVVEGLTSQEANQFFNDCEAVLVGTSYRRIIHIVNPNGRDDSNLGYRFQSLAGWNAERNHTFLHIDTYKPSRSSHVLGGV